jgi:hypothetical protein
MTVVYLELAGLNIQDTQEFFPVGHWDGYVPTLIPQAFQQGIFVGTSENWTGVQVTNGNLISNIPYQGYTTNWNGFSETTPPHYQNIPYIGYTTNFGAAPENIVSQFNNVDLNSVIEYPKTQFVYFKLKGYNPQTLSYENWIVKEDITSRPELYDPGRNPPNVERDVFKTPPSGHALVNITIVARWIQ